LCQFIACKSIPVSQIRNTYQCVEAIASASYSVECDSLLQQYK
jgi:hypothetical protein